MNLVKYGIMDEQCHLRAHVCVVARKVYMFTPENARKAIATGKYPKKMTYPKYAGYQATAEGYVVPPAAIPQIQIYDVTALIEQENFRLSESPTVKGEKALKVVCEMARTGIFCLPSEPRIITDQKRQLAHIDLLVLNAFEVQVKCDFYGGEHPQATGNLYLQIAERNIGYI